MLILTLAALTFAAAQGPVPPATGEITRMATRMANRIAHQVTSHLRADDDDADSDGPGEGPSVTDTTVSVRQGTRLSVENFSGSITVNIWPQDRVRVQTGSDDRQGVDLSGGTVTLRINGNGGRFGEPRDHDLTVTVPAWMELDLNGTEVSITVNGSRAPVRAQTVEGDISLKGGNGPISLKSVDGSITIEDAKGHIELNTVEGEVRARNIEGDLDVQSVDGEISLERIVSQAVTASSVDGTVRYSGTISPGGVYHLESHDGDVILEAGESLDAVVSVNTFDGEFESDWPVTVQGTDRRMTFTLGTGKARVELETFDGKITLRRGSAR